MVIHIIVISDNMEVNYVFFYIIIGKICASNECTHAMVFCVIFSPIKTCFISVEAISTINIKFKTELAGKYIFIFIKWLGIIVVLNWLYS